MAKTTIEQLAEFGQSVWLDYISRSLIASGRLHDMVTLGLRGMTSNPTIFDKAVSSGDEYEKQVQDQHRMGKSTFEIYDDLSVKDIQDAADVFQEVYENTNGLDGFVSLEINPKLAYKTTETIEEGKRLTKKVNRPNVMFKVPATNDGYEAIEALLGEGINVNVTLIFSVGQYRRTAEAYLKGMRKLLQNKGDVSAVRSVASVFVSRVDTAVDNLLDELANKKEFSDTTKKKILSFRGKAAVANAHLIYRAYADIFSGHEFRQLQQEGVNPQRVLWGSTGTKNPAYSDIKYVSELIAKNTVNTVPEHTFEAFMDHGRVKQALTPDVTEAKRIIESLRAFGIDVNTVCNKLLTDGVIAFEQSFDSLLSTIEKRTGKT